MNDNPSTNFKHKKPMTERQKVDWLYYAVHDVVVNSVDYSRDLLLDRIVLIQGGIHKVAKERATRGCSRESADKHQVVVSKLQESYLKMTDAWKSAMNMKNGEMCKTLREVMTVLGELIKGDYLYNEI